MEKGATLATFNNYMHEELRKLMHAKWEINGPFFYEQQSSSRTHVSTLSRRPNGHRTTTTSTSYHPTPRLLELDEISPNQLGGTIEQPCAAILKHEVCRIQLKPTNVAAPTKKFNAYPIHAHWPYSKKYWLQILT